MLDKTFCMAERYLVSEPGITVASLNHTFARDQSCLNKVAHEIQKTRVLPSGGTGGSFKIVLFPLKGRTQIGETLKKCLQWNRNRLL